MSRWGITQRAFWCELRRNRAPACLMLALCCLRLSVCPMIFPCGLSPATRQATAVEV
jgi:hypothetical protein